MDTQTPECHLHYKPEFMSLLSDTIRKKRMRCAYKDLLFSVQASREYVFSDLSDCHRDRYAGYELYADITRLQPAVDEYRDFFEGYHDKTREDETLLRIDLINAKAEFEKTDPDVFVFDDDPDFIAKLPLIYTVFFCSQLFSEEYSAELVVLVAKKILQSIKDSKPEYQFFCKRWLPTQDAGVGLNLYAFTHFIETYMRSTRIALDVFDQKFEGFLSDMKIVLVGLPQPLPDWAKAFEVLDEECQPEHAFVASTTSRFKHFKLEEVQKKEKDFCFENFVKAVYMMALLEKIFEHDNGHIFLWTAEGKELLGDRFDAFAKPAKETEEQEHKKTKLEEPQTENN